MVRRNRVMAGMMMLGALLMLGQVAGAQGGAGRGGPQTRPAPVKLNIEDFGALGDGQTVNTASIQRALNACSASGGGEVIVPAGNFITGSITLGPRTILRFEEGAIITGSPNIADYPVVNVRWEGEWRPGHRALISMDHVNKVGVVGPGKIVGPPFELANLRPNAGRGTARGPSIIEPIDCKDVRLEDFSVEYGRMWTIHLTYCEDVVARNLTIRSTQGRSNGDGIDVDSSRNVLIENCDITTGDDAIALKSGRGMEGVRIARPTENVIIRGCKLSCRSYACVAIGTEMSGGVRNVTIENCTFGEAVNAIFIKAKDGRGGFIENITASNWVVGPGIQHVIHFDLQNKGIAATEEVPGIDGIPRVNNLSFSNIKTQARRLLWVTSISSDKPVENVILSNVTGTCAQAINVRNIKNLTLTNIDVTGFQGDFLTTENVTGPRIDQIKQPGDTTAAE